MLSASNECPPPLLTMIKEGEEDDDGHLKNNNSKKKMMLASKEGGERVMEKAPLKCPRCDSTNTKFCYYNNYSLSQPRHFCKACKRYWTRGGTLRTVPVGGGCRKNKRVIKRVINPNLSSPPNPASITPNSSSPTTCNNNNTSTTSHESLNPSLLYGLPTNLINGFPFSYDNNYHHLGGVSNGLEFGYSTTCTTTPKQILHDLISNSNPFHGSNPSSSTLHQHQHQHQQQQQQQKFSFETLFPYDLDLQIKGVGSHVSEGGGFKDIDSVKLECQVQNGYHQIHQQPTGESDPSILWSANSNGNTSIGVNWLDPNYSNQIGSSSVPSLI